jgi:uncharacterized protein (DUF433 family)
MATASTQIRQLAVPLREDPEGVLRVGKGRVLLELVIRAFKRGQTPEAIVQSFESLALPDVYAVIGYYLADPAPVDEYLREREAAASASESACAPMALAGIRDRLAAHNRLP